MTPLPIRLSNSPFASRVERKSARDNAHSSACPVLWSARAASSSLSSRPSSVVRGRCVPQKRGAERRKAHLSVHAAKRDASLAKDARLAALHRGVFVPGAFGSKHRRRAALCGAWLFLLRDPLAPGPLIGLSRRRTTKGRAGLRQRAPRARLIVAGGRGPDAARVRGCVPCPRAPRPAPPSDASRRRPR
jgi:hypothetical protein